MLHKTERFNAGFGISINKPQLEDYMWEGRRKEFQAKALLSIPVLGVIFAVLILRDNDIKNQVGVKMAALRGILYGSIVGIPAGIALDIVGMITQVKERMSHRRLAVSAGAFTTSEESDYAVVA